MMNSHLTWLSQVKEEIGGYDTLIQYIVSRFNVKYKDPLSSLPRSKGTVLYGKPGTGKTALAISIAKTSSLPYYVLNSPDIFQKGIKLLRHDDFLFHERQYFLLAKLIL
ncbi:hypothetical protein BDF20DRAFT_880124 [Mycotypha africana]|uniref:uncharacterized protein n=1 Tax=Mycotypha africana TaxID=64632 RepID=UPI002300FBF2|nr:uncharacterized protein BDF20DRAFT_880124 [Mycotypha africana]KAI8975691.1 hypothetical protein BDF20DRAFT_880124 [Mycotypha africana]